ncbi:MAG TPA: DUF393 domain-containing protein [Lysobacter sp.]|nr:DUF393 domain-containing protein [Lysobacter sp.]
MSEEAPAAKVYYNSACPVCRSGIEAQQGRMEACRIEWIDVHANPEAVAEVGADLEAVRERLYVRDAGGNLHVGADAFSRLWRDTPGQRWLGRLAGLPGLKRIAHAAYDWFARRLYRWNRRKGHW